ncbi:putative disease resistance protein At4g11170 [Neltuma alba]|uniref:putative disease resistance protein At4g11170 n=1 Tax=Neltuma alba TaxID=207710 RepID=UPI0010A398D4|nr:putative disease resistance protein At4g11170 [Prosopis alba]
MGYRWYRYEYLARAIFHKLKAQFEAFSLVEDGRGKEGWESSLEKMKKAPPKWVLKLSFDRLDEHQKNRFLDIAFFIKERVKVSLKLIRQLYGSSVDIDINVLKDRSLTSFDHNGYIEMHDLVRDMGVEIARE